MAEIRAIETHYNGYRFRSRLEARWAVFMDNLSIEYIYEPEGFDLGDGYYYLPDFYLPNTNAWVEIKGKDITDNELEKIIRFCEAKCDFVNGGSKFRLLCGEVPDLLTDGSYHGIGVGCYNFLSVDECSKFPYRIKTTRGILHPDIWTPVNNEDEIRNALLKARKARFEFGECG